MGSLGNLDDPMLCCGGHLDNADNLLTVTYFWPSGTFAGRVQRVINHDGTMQLCLYEESDDMRTTTVLSGQPNGDWTDVINGTKTVTIVDQAGRTISRQVFDLIYNSATTPH